MKPRVVIWGVSGHASVVAEILCLQNEYSIVGFLDDVNPERQRQQIGGLPILGGREQLKELHERAVTHFIFGFGQCAARLTLASFVRANGFAFATAIHPQAIVSAAATIGEGTVVAAGAVINAGAMVGANALVSTCASVGHDCVLGDAVHIGPGARLGGWAKVGAATWIGIGAIVLDRRQIGAHCVVGGGSVVTRDLGAKVVANGSPARKIRSVIVPKKCSQEPVVAGC